MEKQANIFFGVCYEILVGNNHEEEQKLSAVNGSGFYVWFGRAEWHAQRTVILAGKIYDVLHNTKYSNHRIVKFYICKYKHLKVKLKVPL